MLRKFKNKLSCLYRDDKLIIFSVFLYIPLIIFVIVNIPRISIRDLFINLSYLLFAQIDLLGDDRPRKSFNAILKGHRDNAAKILYGIMALCFYFKVPHDYFIIVFTDENQIGNIIYTVIALIFLYMTIKYTIRRVTAKKLIELKSDDSEDDIPF